MRPSRRMMVWIRQRFSVFGLNPNRDIATQRRLSAVVCLLGLAFLYAHIAALAFATWTGVCCAGQQCPIAAHHHSTAKSAGAAQDCGHDMQHDMSRMDGCSMSCCHTLSAVATHAQFYLLAPPWASSDSAPVLRAVSTPASRMSFVTLAPPVPPPKSPTEVA